MKCMDVSSTPLYVQFLAGPDADHTSGLRCRSNPRPLLLLGPPPMAVGKSGLGFAVSLSIKKLGLWREIQI